MAQAVDAAAAIALQQMLMGSGKPEGRPSEPNAPQQPLGLPSPGGEPTPQEAGGEPAGQDIMGQMRNITESAPGMTE